MDRTTLRLPIDLTLLDGPRLAAAVARVAPWTTPGRLVAIAIVSIAALAANLHVAGLALRGSWLLAGMVVAFWTLVGIGLRELGRASAAARAGRSVVAIRVALRRGALPAFHTEMYPAWALAEPRERWRITAAGVVLQGGLAAVLALLSPVLGGSTSVIASLVTLALVAWTLATGERAFLRQAPALRGAVVAAVESRPARPKPARGGSARGNRGLAWFVLLGFGLPGLLLSGHGAWQAVVQEQRLLTARPVEAVVVATSLVERTAQKRGATYRPLVRHRFELQGRSYESVHAYPLPMALTETRARRFVARFPVGTRVVTHVPAGDPRAAYLVAHRQGRFAGMALVGLLVFLLAFTAWRVLLRAAKGSVEPPAVVPSPAAATDGA